MVIQIIVIWAIRSPFMARGAYLFIRQRHTRQLASKPHTVFHIRSRNWLPYGSQTYGEVVFMWLFLESEILHIPCKFKERAVPKSILYLKITSITREE